ncbi:cytochrome P450 CYP72A219 [Senna tora]|uniref:Cytochrome P450 CYP72A219 n=1 Tax=Senna tora TaxID=362788 RepID=A0A834TRL5_9FABA|nr:cytochrome P450 CYP72A219 [Senna tora]
MEALQEEAAPLSVPIWINNVATLVMVAGVIIALVRVVNSVWVKPRTLERWLTQQNLKGNSYRFVYGDLKEMEKMVQHANSKPISLDDDIVPRIIPFHLHIIRNYGEKCFIWLGGRPMVNTTNPEELKDVFNKISVFQKIPNNPLAKLLVSGIIEYNGETWVKHRKIINPAFHHEKLKLMLPAFYECCNKMVNEWKKLVSESENGSMDLDVWPWSQGMTADVISRTAFGSSCEEGRKVLQLQIQQAHLTHKVLRSIYIPGWRFVPTKLNRRLKELEKEITLLLRGIINKREKGREEGEAPTDDLLGILLESNHREMEDNINGNNKNVGMSIEDVSQLASSSKRRGPPTLWLYPPAPILTRVVLEETRLGNLRLPAGSGIVIPAILVHQDPLLWGDDAKDFNPQRFCEGISKATKSQTSYLPFGWGPRICIGQNFALLEVKMALCLILQNFSFELSPSYTHAPIVVLTLQPQFGTHIILHKLY